MLDRLAPSRPAADPERRRRLAAAVRAGKGRYDFGHNRRRTAEALLERLEGRAESR